MGIEEKFPKNASEVAQIDADLEDEEEAERSRAVTRTSTYSRYQRGWRKGTITINRVFRDNATHYDINFTTAQKKHHISYSMRGNTFTGSEDSLAFFYKNGKDIPRFSNMSGSLKSAMECAFIALAEHCRSTNKNLPSAV